MAAGVMVPVAPTTAGESAPEAAGEAPPTAAKPAPLPTVGDEKAVDLRLGSPGSPDRREIRRPGAQYVKVHFSRLTLARGDYLTVADPSGREVHTYHGDPTRGGAAKGDASFTRHGRTGFAAMSVDGDTAVITLHTREGRNSAATIDRYWRGYSDKEIKAKNGPGVFSVCGADGRRDTVCYKENHPAQYNASRPVARMLTNGNGWCTAWRVGRGNHMMTNNHCVKTQAELDTMEVQFNYDCATCGGNNPGPGTKVGANQLLRNSAELDFALFNVDNFDQISQFGTLFLETRAPVINERAYVIGHGDTKPKRISLFEERDGGAYCAVKTTGGNSVGYSCDTSGGNSGSPVLAGSSHKVIALHWGGSCPNNVGNRMDRIYPQIQDLIDNRA
ncbi:trypsin-like peptidase domain-containing protein [Streptomyces flavofungini]|uniref:Trypsin-like peptidase domain-containing protein n=1 Tax=Streptomyces flavofungini TaxID=68200 RepID=A0ABS0X7V6_9ACTN|nr:trypsin-like peptidase domain-containing protein [Streptomyces flavofungini]